MDPILGNDKHDLTLPQEQFSITDERGANWLLKRLREIEDEAAVVKSQAEIRIAELAADREKLLFLYGDQFKAWARAEADRRRRQTVTLAQGSACFRSVRQKFTLRDREAAYVHSRTAHPELITRSEVEKFDTEGYVRAAQETGEMMPGLDSVPEYEAFSYSFTKKSKGGATTEGESDAT